MIPVRKLRLLATAAAGLAGLSLAGAAHAAPSRDGQAALDAFAADLGYRCAVLDNRAAPNAFSSSSEASRGTPVTNGTRPGARWPIT